MTRVFVDERHLQGDSAALDAADAHHLVNVLRMGMGDELTVVGPDGREHPAEIVEVAGERVLLRLGEARPARIEPDLELTLYHGLPRLPRYETALRMCTELGVAGFVPVLCRRSVIRLQPDDYPRKTERWRRIVESAARQCGRTRIPEVSGPMDFAAALAHVSATDAAGVMPSAGLAGAEVLSLGEWVDAHADEIRRGPLALFIGPESGFDLAEEAEAQAAGVSLVTMGPRVLRTETAAVVAATVCLERAGQMD